MCFSGDTIELQSDYGGEYPAVGWFMHMANQTNWRSQGDTAQGMYVAAADGTAYCWKNTPGISTTLRFMDRGLAAFRASPPKPVQIKDEQLKEEFTRSPKPDSSVIQIFSRIRPVPEGADSRNYNIGRDYLWIYKNEVEEIVDAAKRKPEGFSLPDYVVARIARYSLVDSIRGQPDFWDAGDVRVANFVAHRMPAGDDNQIRIGFRGIFKQTTTWYTRGLEGKIEGEFKIDGNTFKISRFRAYVNATAWGASAWSNRGVPKGRFPIVFAMVEANDALSKDVPPGAVSRNMIYRHPEISDIARHAANMK